MGIITDNYDKLVSSTTISVELVTYLWSKRAISIGLKEELSDLPYTKTQKATKLYDFFERSTTEKELEHLRTGLKISGNTYALQILQTGVCVNQQTVPKTMGCTNPTNKFIYSGDLARYFDKSTQLPKKWKNFAEELEIKEGTISHAQRRVSNNESYQEIFSELLIEWVGKLGRKCTMQLLCSKLEKVDCTDIADALRIIPGITNEMVISSIRKPMTPAAERLELP